MERYDFVFAGGSLAGLSLAYQISRTRFSRAKILIVDSNQPGSGERTWSFWSTGDTPFIELATGAWQQARFASSGFQADIDLSPYRYYTIRGDDFFSHVLSDLERRPNIEFRTDEVIGIRDEADTAVVQTAKGEYSATWVFDSRFDPEDYLLHPPAKYHALMQHFQGWLVDVDEPVFDPGLPTLFDFNVPRKRDMRFMYLLPYSSHRALVEFTLFSAELLEHSEYAQNIEAYLRDNLGVERYRVVGRESGVIPMTDRPFPRTGGKRILNIGTRAGLVKPSTGYAFRNIQEDTLRIAESLERHGSPMHVPSRPGAYAVLDTLLLQIIHRRGELSERVFSALFGKNPIDRLFRFLDEETSLWDTVRLMSTVPWAPFIGAWFRTRILRRV